MIAFRGNTANPKGGPQKMSRSIHAATALRFVAGLAVIAVAAVSALGCAPRTAPAVPRASTGTQTLVSPAWRAAFPGADSLRVERVAAGVEHAYAWVPAGPWAIHVLAIDGVLCRAALEVAHPGPPLTAAAGVSTIAHQAVAIAAMNADFFALPAGTPVGAQVSQGEIHIGPGRRPVFAVTDSGYRLWTAKIRGIALHKTDSALIEQVNRPRAGDAGHPRVAGLTMFTEWWGRPTSVDPGAITLAVRITFGTSTRGKGVVTATTRTGSAAIGPGRIALQGDTAVSWLKRRAVGDTIEWNSALQSADAVSPPAGARLPHVTEAVGGFPVLLRDGKVITDAGEPIGATFGPVRHPRTAIGWSNGGNRLLWVVVDGRQKPYSDGMTLAELTTLFQQLGATDAMNLDGGGSTTLLIRNRIVNRVSDANGERAVGNAILLKSCSLQGGS